MDEEEGKVMISNVRALMAGVDRERVWIMTIGVMGIILFIVFAGTMLTFSVLRPEGLVGREVLRPIFQASIWLSGICSVISVIAGVKVLFFIRTWHRSYSNLRAAEKKLEKDYFGAIKKP